MTTDTLKVIGHEAVHGLWAINAGLIAELVIGVLFLIALKNGWIKP